MPRSTRPLARHRRFVVLPPTLPAGTPGRRPPGSSRTTPMDSTTSARMRSATSPSSARRLLLLATRTTPSLIPAATPFRVFVLSGVTGATLTVPASESAQHQRPETSLPMPLSGVSPVERVMEPATPPRQDTTLSADTTMVSNLPRLKSKQR